MNDAFASAVAKLRSSSQSLNQLTDQIAESIRNVEEFLNETCSAGVNAAVTVSSYSNDEGCFTEYMSLAYTRVGSRFRIAVVEGMDFDPETATVTAWAECTRAVKLETAAKLPDLIQEIAKKIDERVDEATKTYEATSAVVRSLRGKE